MLKKKTSEDTENDDEGESQDGSSKNSESENDQPRKKAKSGKKTKPIIETPLNLKINAKIWLLHNCWMCLKAGCSSEHCFVHPEYSEHFSLGHDHFAFGQQLGYLLLGFHFSLNCSRILYPH
ncbi:hypothetical protein EDB19DRAFT_1830229 [Suillus lakei]|nr:hypothetical protein EDB19DRAFT_1830229 [Suillus lakei]